ncbi:methyltransferase [Novispirillum itersonii subsp. nipponicum]
MTGPDAAGFIRRHTAVTAPGLIPELSLYLATDVTPLWSATQDFLDQNGLEPPFWAFAWPGGQALARLLLDQPESVRGKTVLSFAAGGGVEAIAAARSGAARVLANDIDPIAQVACGLNAGLNGVTVDLCGKDLLGGSLPDGWERPEVILAGDVCYDREMAARVIPWLRDRAGAGAVVLMADPGRAYLPDGEGLMEVGRYTVPTSRAVEESEHRDTRIFRWQARG